MAKPKDRTFRLRGWMGAAIGFPSAAAILLSRPFVPFGTWAGVACDAAGWAFLALGLSLRLSSILFVGGRKGKELVTTGPYSHCRNPLYLGSLMLALSIAAFLHSLSLVAAMLVTAAFYLWAVIPSEESQLSALFPEEWKAYVARVPRIEPRGFPLTWGRDRLEVDLRAFRNESLRALGMLAVPLLAVLLNHGRAQAWWPKLWWLP